ncbi:MAG: hypothetical protein KKB04_01890 [Candidatus Thermoplasmatota archaeon]|nr:hypothetical protein [Candidatus Thermoplasmatota archaeon]
MVIFVKEIKNLWVVPIVILIMGLVVFGYGLRYMLGGNIGYLAGSVMCVSILIVIILLTTFAELKGIKPAEEPSEITEEAPKEEISEEKKEEIEEERLAEEKIEEVLKEEEEVSEEKIEEEVKEDETEEEEAAEEKEESEEDMVVCGGCGALVPASSKKCPNCGAEFEE